MSHPKRRARKAKKKSAALEALKKAQRKDRLVLAIRHWAAGLAGRVDVVDQIWSKKDIEAAKARAKDLDPLFEKADPT